MGAIATQYGPNQAPVLAVKAGADILLMPVDPPGAIQAVVAAVETGEITRSRIEASVRRIFTAKSRTLEQQSFCLESLSQIHDWQLTEEILRNSQIVGHTVSQNLDFESGLNCLIGDDWLQQDYLNRNSPGIKIAATLGFNYLELVDRHTPLQQLESSLEKPTLIQLFSRGNPFRGSAGLSSQAQAKIKQLARSPHLMGIVIYGSPYILDWLKPQIPENLPYVFTYGQNQVAQQLALTTLFNGPGEP
jgi:beta-glucosidase